MDVKLVVVGGDAKAAEYDLRLPTIVGRSRGADLKLHHPLVSRKHCELFEQDEQLMVRDLGSLNGTFIGESRIADVEPLPPGAMVTIGSVTFQAVYGDMEVEQFVESDTGEMPDFTSAPAATATPIEQTLEMSDFDSPATEAVEGEPAEAGFDFGWLEETPEAEVEVEPEPVKKAAPKAAKAAPQVTKSASPAKRADPKLDDSVEIEVIADIEEVDDEELRLPDPTAAAGHNGQALTEEINEFAPPAEQPAGGGGDDDLNSFFASLK